MATTPLRPYDERKTDVGIWTGPPMGPEFAGDRALAGRSYAIGCTGQQTNNPGEPESNWSVGPGTIEEADGTIKRYFLVGGERAVDYYCKNDGITAAKYQALVDAENEAAKNYCSDSINGIHYLTDPNCGYVRTVERNIGVDIWYPQVSGGEDLPDPLDKCATTDQVISTITLTGTDTGLVIGSGPYALESDVATAVVHAGIIAKGQKAIIKVISDSNIAKKTYEGSTRFGVTSKPRDSRTEGVISTVTISIAGSQIDQNSASVVPNPGNQGDDAAFRVTTSSQGSLTGVLIESGGRNYKLGDSFNVVSLGLGGAQTPGRITVTSVVEQNNANDTGLCSVRYELEQLLVDELDTCEVITDKEFLTLDKTVSGSRGPINTFELLNPDSNPDKVLDAPINKPGPNFNWYKNCVPVDPDIYPEIENKRYNMFYVEGPSDGEPGRNFGFSFSYNYTWFTNENGGKNINDGCLAAGGGGPITSINILDRGERNVNNPRVTDGFPNNGTGATFNVNATSDGTINSVSISNPGQDYKVGDQFIYTSTYVFNYPQDGSWEVTGVAGGGQSDEYINWRINSATIKDGKGGAGFAVGDIFEVRLQDEGDDSIDVPARFRVSTIIAEETVTEGTIEYEVQYDMTVTWDLNGGGTLEEVYDIVQEVNYDSTTDVRLRQSCESIMNLTNNNLGRNPTRDEFRYWSAQFYRSDSDDGRPTATEAFAWNDSVEDEKNNRTLLNIVDRCVAADTTPDDNTAQDPKDDGDVSTSGENCIWDRSTFYRGRDGLGYRAELNSLWNFLGQPSGPSGSGPAVIADIQCPRPQGDAGYISDNEPDMSDFAGMRLWRWVQCSDGSNGGDSSLGGFTEVYVPCPGTGDGCNNPIKSTTLADYNKDAKYFWADGFSKVGNYVKTPKGTNATAINAQYLSILGRNAEEAGLIYWTDEAERTYIDPQGYAIFWPGARMKFADGFETTGNFVKETTDAQAEAVNNKYLVLLGRPAEEAGLIYWTDEAKRIGITETLKNIEFAAATELDRGGVTEYAYGLDRTLEHIAYAAQTELERGGVTDFKLFCDTQVSGDIDLSWFIDTRLPQTFGAVTINNPTITGELTNDVIYIANSPATQTTNYKGFQEAAAINSKGIFLNSFNLTWPEPGGSQPGEVAPIHARALKAEFYVEENAIGVKKFELIDYDNDALQSVFGERDTAFFGLPEATPATWDGYTNPWGGNLSVDKDDGGNWVDGTYICNFAYMPFISGDDPSGFSIPLSEAEKLTFDNNPEYGKKMWVKLTAYNYALSPVDNSVLTSKTKQFQASADQNANRFLEAWGSGPGPVGPVGTGPVGPGPVGPGGGCNSLSVSCGSGASLYVETNEPTKITFSYRVNGASNCSTKGSAKVSILRYWPCPEFGPASGEGNKWLPGYIKKPVSIVDGEAKIELSVNTSKNDYLPTSKGDQTVDDPGSCHWVYVAYWEINGMGATSIDCNYNAWDNPGCDFGGGAKTQLQQIFCLQDDLCVKYDGDNGGCNIEELYGGYPWANGIVNDIDPETCLPWCDTSGQNHFYWCCPGQQPNPGVNCTNRDGSAPDNNNTQPGECAADCPVCEQSIKVYIGDTTECGPLAKPFMREGGGPGINSGAVTVGNAPRIATPGFTPTVIDKQKANIKTNFQGFNYIDVKLEAWTYLAPKTIAGQTTLGIDKAVAFSGEDLQALYDECCPNNTSTYGCQSFIAEGKCQAFEDGELQSGVEVDCDEKVRYVAEWYYKSYWKNGRTVYDPIGAWENFNTEDEAQYLQIPEDYYPVSAGNNFGGMPLSYAGEKPEGSMVSGSDTRPIVVGVENRPNDPVWQLEKVEIFLSFKASNDLWGNTSYHPPPAGFNEGDFGIATTVSSPRPPWNIGTQGPGPKDPVFLVATFAIGETIDLPEAEWEGMYIEGCDTAQVYTPQANPSTVTCGDPQFDEDGEPQGDNWYQCSLWYKDWEERGSVNGEYFSRGYPQSGGCNPEARGFPNCIPESDVVLGINESTGSGIFSADWKDYVPGGCATGLKVMWYLEGVCVSRGDHYEGLGDGGYYLTWNALSCGFRTIDLSKLMTDADREYKVEVYVVATNSPEKIAWRRVNFDWKAIYQDPNSDPYSYTDWEEWAIHRRDNKRPVDVEQEGGTKEGDFWQKVLSYATCTVKGNDGTGDDKLTGLQTPDFYIESYDESWQGATGNLPCYTAAERDCCNPVYAANNPTNRCEEEIVGVIYDCCDENFGNGKLRVVLANSQTAWPLKPGTSDRVVGAIKYKWERQNNQNLWEDVPGGTGNAITYTADGRSYRCTVTYDLAGFVPNGLEAQPEKTQATRTFNADDQPTEECEDGTTAPIGQCPDSSPCKDPEFVQTSTPNVWINDGGTKVTEIQVDKNKNVRVNIQAMFKNFSSDKLVYERAQAFWYTGSIIGSSGPSGTATLTPDINPNTTNTDNITFNGSFDQQYNAEVSFTYSVSIQVFFRCADTGGTFVAQGFFSAASITWGEKKQPQITAGPECRYWSAATNSQGCGSYIATVTDPNNGTVKNYYMTKLNGGIDDLGPEYSPQLTEQYASCSFCPATSCPTLSITGVTISPTNPKVGDQVSATVSYSWDNKGFTTTGTSVRWTGDGAQTATLGYKTGNPVILGPYTSKGTKNINVAVTKSFADPNRECPVSQQSNIYGFKLENLNYTFNVGEGGPGPGPVGPGPGGDDDCTTNAESVCCDPNNPAYNGVTGSPPYQFTCSSVREALAQAGKPCCSDSDGPGPGPGPGPGDGDVAPVMSGTITGDKNLTLSGGKVVGNYKMSYTLDPGSGYSEVLNNQGNPRDITVGWEGATGEFNKFNYAKTFTTANQNASVGARIAKLYAKPGYSGSLIINNVPQDQRYWAYDDVALTGIRVNAETVNDVPPSASIRVTKSANEATLDSSGKAVLRFSATATVSDGTYTPTSEPTALRYNIINGSTANSPSPAQNTLTKNWSHTFTAPGTYTVGARYRKNYCAAGRTSCNNTDSSNTFVFAEDEVTVTIKAGGPTGTKPKAQMQPVTYSSTQGGCGYGLSGISTPVEATATVQLTQGTGDFVYARAEASGYTKNGNTLQKSFARNRVGVFNGTVGTTVKFYNSAGELIHSAGSGNQDWCITIEQFTFNPGDGPGLDPF